MNPDEEERKDAISMAHRDYRLLLVGFSRQESDIRAMVSDWRTYHQHYHGRCKG